MERDGARRVARGMDHPGPAAERQHLPVGHLAVDPGGRRLGDRQPVLVQRPFPVEQVRFRYGELAPDHRRVQRVGEDLGAVAVRQLLSRAVVVTVAMGEDDAPDPGGVEAKAPYRVLDRGRRTDVPGVDQRQVRPVTPEIGLADPEAEHVQVPGEYLDEIHAANVRRHLHPPYRTTLPATSPRANDPHFGPPCAPGRGHEVGRAVPHSPPP